MASELMIIVWNTKTIRNANYKFNKQKSHELNNIYKNKQFICQTNKAYFKMEQTIQAVWQFPRSIQTYYLQNDPMVKSQIPFLLKI